MARLRITSGPSAGRTVVIEGELTIGREQADLVNGSLRVTADVEVRVAGSSAPSR